MDPHLLTDSRQFAIVCSPAFGGSMSFGQPNRRELILLLGSATAAWPFAARAQPADRARLVGVLLTSVESDPQMQARFSALREGLANLGWTDAGNIRLEPRWIAGSAERATHLTKELVDLAPDVIVANSTTAIEAVMKETRQIPTVFVLVGDPVGSGYVASLARPGGNVTGFSAFDPEIAGKWIQALKEIAPATSEVVVLFSPGYEFLWRGAEATAAALGVRATRATCRTNADLESAIAAAAAQPSRGLVVLPTPLFAISRDLIIGLAARHKLPAVYPFRYFAESSGLMSYGLDTIDIFRRSASYVDRILKGEKPAELPVQAPTKFELVINLKTAKALGLQVPPTLLSQADEVIE